MFGTQQNQGGGGLFNQGGQQSGFGSQTQATPGFGAPQQQQGSTGGLFGAKPAQPGGIIGGCINGVGFSLWRWSANFAGGRSNQFRGRAINGNRRPLWRKTCRFSWRSLWWWCTATERGWCRIGWRSGGRRKRRVVVIPKSNTHSRSRWRALRRNRRRYSSGRIEVYLRLNQRLERQLEAYLEEEEVHSRKARRQRLSSALLHRRLHLQWEGDCFLRNSSSRDSRRACSGALNPLEEDCLVMLLVPGADFSCNNNNSPVAYLREVCFRNNQLNKRMVCSEVRRCWRSWSTTRSVALWTTTTTAATTKSSSFVSIRCSVTCS